MRKHFGHRLWFVFILSVLAWNEIYAQETGIMQAFTCEFNTTSLSCDNNNVINIISAFYGRTNRETCPSWSDGSTTCSANNALQKVQDICQNQRTCKVNASNDVFGDPCAGVKKYLEVSYECKLSEWVMVFKGVANAGLPDLYKLWHENSSLNALDDSARALDGKHKAHFKSPIVDRWSELNVTQVKISFYINDQEAAFISFNGSDTNKENWFSQNNIIGSSYKLKEKEFNFFSLAGHNEEDVYRRFFTSTMYGGCPNDFGFSVVLTQERVGRSCEWEFKGTPYPVIMISPGDDAVRWQSESPHFADFFAIFIDFSDPTCSHDVVTIDDVTYTFEASPSDFLAHSLELCNFEQNHPLAVRMCITNPGGRADWGKVTVKKCEININTLSQDYSGQIGEDSTFDKVLTYFSIIGCVISIVFLVVTILTFTYFKHLRGKLPQRILINLCVSLLFLNLTFVIGIELTSCYYCCILVAILLHYFVLASFFWMLVEAINMYLKFVLVFYEEIRFFMFKSVLLGWLFPVIPVLVIAVSDYETYSNDHYCFMKPGMPLYFGLITISAIILIINAGIYAQIIRRLACRRWATKIKSEKETISEVAVRVQNAIAIMMLLGLTWLFGFLAIYSSDAVNDISQLLFCVFNSLQGFFIFLFFCVRRKDVRNSWAYCCCKVGEKSGFTTTSKQRYATETTTVSGNLVRNSIYWRNQGGIREIARSPPAEQGVPLE